MDRLNAAQYTHLDKPEILTRLFHPRPEFGTSRAGEDLNIPVADGVHVGARFHRAGRDAPTVLFFHGNGEIVADYDELAPYINRLGAHFLPVDYRGYGRSSGTPTVSAMMQDCHRIYAFVRTWLAERGEQGPLVVMGRSLGSAPALEVARASLDEIGGVIIESGFAHLVPLLELLGVDVGVLNITEASGVPNLDAMAAITCPTLVIHAELDHIIPYAEGETLFAACPATDKRLVRIAGANHNDILARGLNTYLSALGDFLGQLGGHA
jgi:hypothetical protein